MTNEYFPQDGNGKPEDLGDKEKAGSLITVLLVDDHKMVIKNMKKVISAHPEMKIIGTASNGEEAIQMAKKTSPEVILMDINMPVMDGIEATKKITVLVPKICIIGLSLHDIPKVVDDMKRAGASAYVKKGESPNRMYDVIKKQVRAANI